MAERGKERVSSRTKGVVRIAILCSCILGLVREMVIASFFGATR
jgi:peptidoglycan biosynthesis protein MviN/MurJ (putative lipid II flippase)